MKVILSRKGFDSAIGGYPSPILPDGRLISLPIPESLPIQDPDDGIKYSDLHLEGERTYFDLVKQLKSKIRYDKKWHELTKDTQCHIDPDIYRNIRIENKPRPLEWKACFGQVGTSQSHLINQDVKIGDLFLFFGWFKQTILKNKKLSFDKSAPDLHIIFGYLQIGKILQNNNNNNKIPKWMEYHPHANVEHYKQYKEKQKNTIYVAREKSCWDDQISGAGVFKYYKKDDDSYSSNLVLTRENFSKSRWDINKLPFEKVNMTFHSENSWKNGYFQSVGRGQEFVIEENENVKNWAKKTINSRRGLI